MEWKPSTTSLSWSSTSNPHMKQGKFNPKLVGRDQNQIISKQHAATLALHRLMLRAVASFLVRPIIRRVVGQRRQWMPWWIRGTEIKSPTSWAAIPQARRLALILLYKSFMASSHHIFGLTLHDRIYQVTLVDVLADFFLSDRRCRSFSSKPSSLLFSSSRTLLSSLSVTTFNENKQENNWLLVTENKPACQENTGLHWYTSASAVARFVFRVSLSVSSSCTLAVNASDCTIHVDTGRVKVRKCISLLVQAI